MKHAKKFYDIGVRKAFITIGFMGHGNIRNQLYEQLKYIGYTVPNIIDGTAVVSKCAELEDGIFVGKMQLLMQMPESGKCALSILDRLLNMIVR